MRADRHEERCIKLASDDDVCLDSLCSTYFSASVVLHLLPNKVNDGTEHELASKQLVAHSPLN